MFINNIHTLITFTTRHIKPNKIEKLLNLKFSEYFRLDKMENHLFIQTFLIIKIFFYHFSFFCSIIGSNDCFMDLFFNDLGKINNELFFDFLINLNVAIFLMFFL